MGLQTQESMIRQYTTTWKLIGLQTQESKTGSTPQPSGSSTDPERDDEAPNPGKQNQAVYCTENQIYVFTEMKLHSLVPSSFVHISVSDLLIPRIGLSIWLQQNRQTDPGNI
jgi:hypothetical protein